MYSAALWSVITNLKKKSGETDFRDSSDLSSLSLSLLPDYKYNIIAASCSWGCLPNHMSCAPQSVSPNKLFSPNNLLVGITNILRYFITANKKTNPGSFS